MRGFIRHRRLKSGGVCYYPIVKINGKQVYLGSFSTRRNAEARLMVAEFEIAKGTFGSLKDITFADYLDVWIKQHAE